MASIQDTYDQLPHPADLEGLADVAERASTALACALEACEALSDEAQIAESGKLTSR